MKSGFGNTLRKQVAVPVAPSDGQVVSNWAIVAQMVTWLLIVFGWCWVDHRSSRQDSRKETLALMDQLRKDVDALSEKAISYYVSAPSDESPNQDLLGKIDREFAAMYAKKPLS
jgi:hypothetical protein